MHLDSKIRRKLDLIGILLCAAGLVMLVYGISQASGPAGFFSGAVMIPGGIGLVILTGFIWWESRFQFPALEAVGTAGMQATQLFLDPKAAIAALEYDLDDLAKAIQDTVEATLRNAPQLIV